MSGGGRLGCSAILGVHLQAIDEPVSVMKSGWIVLHKVLASPCLGGASGISGPDTTGPVATEGNVKDQLLVLDFVVNIARTGKLTLRKTPV